MLPNLNDGFADGPRLLKPLQGYINWSRWLWFVLDAEHAILTMAVHAEGTVYFTRSHPDDRLSPFW